MGVLALGSAVIGSIVVAATARRGLASGRGLIQLDQVLADDVCGNAPGRCSGVLNPTVTANEKGPAPLLNKGKQGLLLCVNFAPQQRSSNKVDAAPSTDGPRKPTSVAAPAAGFRPLVRQPEPGWRTPTDAQSFGEGLLLRLYSWVSGAA